MLDHQNKERTFHSAASACDAALHARSLQPGRLQPCVFGSLSPGFGVSVLSVCPCVCLSATAFASASFSVSVCVAGRKGLRFGQKSAEVHLEPWTRTFWFA